MYEPSIFKIALKTLLKQLINLTLTQNVHVLHTRLIIYTVHIIHKDSVRVCVWGTLAPSLIIP